jgi:hypothetical protein
LSFPIWLVTRLPRRAHLQFSTDYGL